MAIPAGRERRVYERASYFARVSISTPPGSPPVDGRTIDISLGGVGLAGPTRLDSTLGEAIAVTFYPPDPKKGTVEERVLGRVVWARRESDCCVLGIEFSEPIHPSAYPALSRLIERL